MGVSHSQKKLPASAQRGQVREAGCRRNAVDRTWRQDLFFLRPASHTFSAYNLRHRLCRVWNILFTWPLAICFPIYDKIPIIERRNRACPGSCHSDEDENDVTSISKWATKSETSWSRPTYLLVYKNSLQYGRLEDAWQPTCRRLWAEARTRVSRS